MGAAPISASGIDGARIEWPGGAPFAFAIVDDTDKTTLENGPLVYDALTAAGIPATKTVWPIARDGAPRTGGATCAEPDYAAWVLELQAAGHEIAFHNATDRSSTRDRTIEALDTFRDLFGHDPRVGSNHSANVESIYWCGDRVSGAMARAYDLAGRVVWDHEIRSLGHVPGDPHFWGDVCRQRIDYWRNFTFDATNTLAPCPTLPYHDPDRPFVRWWYAATEAPHLEPFLVAVSPARLDALAAAGGACILYTHFGTDYVRDGALDPRFVAAIRDLVDRGGWMATTSELLDHLRAHGGEHVLDDRQRRALEHRWIVDQVVRRGPTRVRSILARRRRERIA